MTKILAFGSFKQSGKSSSCEFLTEYLNKVKIKKIDPICTDFNGNPWESEESPTVKVYSFADKLKQFAVECLGLTEAQAYGSDDDKNSLTHLRWEDMPGICHLSPEDWYICDHWQDVSHSLEKFLSHHENGQMTAREVLQYFGTGICRKMYPNVWVDACIRQIKKDNLDYALIADMRFFNEAEAISKAGGKTIGFMRRPFPNDTHQSEVDLIGYPFDATIDNTNLSLEEKNQKVLTLLKDWNWL